MVLYGFYSDNLSVEAPAFRVFCQKANFLHLKNPPVLAATVARGCLII